MKVKPWSPWKDAQERDPQHFWLDQSEEEGGHS